MGRAAALAAAIVMFFDCASNAKTSPAAPSGASGGNAAKTRYVAVVETEIDAQSGASAELNPAEVRQITAALRREAVENLPRGTYHIMTSETVQSMGGAVLEECSDENCVVTLGAKIGADYIVRGTISKYGTKFTLSAEMYETDNGTLVASSEYVRADNTAELMDKTVTASANMYKKFVNPAYQPPAPAYQPPASAYQPPAPAYQPPGVPNAAAKPTEAAPAYRQSQTGGSGTITDNRDGKTYKTVVIGGKRWMAENLNVNRGNSWCYDNNNSYCNKYGRLYDWNTARTVCMAGWHLPSRREWGDLAVSAGGTGEYGAGGRAGTMLKSASGWVYNGNGTDYYGFSAQAGGARHPTKGFVYDGIRGHWWTSTAASAVTAYYRRMDNDIYFVRDNDDAGITGFGFSVRCVAD